MSEPDYVLHHSIVDKNGDQYVQPTLTPTADQREKIILAKPYIIPVLFIPGIMGTNLCKKGSRDIAWRPPNIDPRGAADAIAQLFIYLFKGTKQRQSELSTDGAEVDPRGAIDAGGCGLSKRVLVARGWGSILRTSYHPVMGRLQQDLNNLAAYDFSRKAAELKGWAAESGQESPRDWGAASGEALSREEILHAANYQFDVWAGGYLWLQSNRDSGAAIKDYIESTILPYYNEAKGVVVDAPDDEGNPASRIQRGKPARPLAEKVIVVTHSMGGLVSRSLTEIHKCDKVMGVSHGAQPATGAPDTYKRMRAGADGVAQLFMGRNAADLVAILTQAPGGLELLPTADYNDGKPWLKVRERANPNETGAEPCLSLPKNGDPYEEIYKAPDWYGLVPDFNLGLMNPGGGKETAPVPGGETDDDSPRKALNKSINKVKDFHRDIQGKYREHTYAHYGIQGERDLSLERGGVLAAANRFAYGQVVWEGPGGARLDPAAVTLVADDGNGEIQLSNGLRLSIAEADTPGDGTVAAASADAPRRAGVAGVFIHGQGQPGRHNQAFGYEHQEDYNDERALYATLYAIIKIAQQAQWHKRPAKDES